MVKRNHLDLPRVGDGGPIHTKMDADQLRFYYDCTYDVSIKYDALHAKDKITIKFYDSGGFIVWKEEYYANQLKSFLR